MSHRVTTRTEIKDSVLAKQALKQAGMAYQESGDTLHITSGGMRGAVINLKTGEVSGDSDYGHTRDNLGSLRQAYGEAKYRAECMKQGITISSRAMEGENVVLYCRMA